MPVSDSNTRTINIQWEQEVTRADPNWRRDAKLIPQLQDTDGLPETRAQVTIDWASTGPYE